MSNQTLNKLMVQQMFQEYQFKHDVVFPKIQDIKFVKSDMFWAKFDSSDLYNKKYILYIANDLLDKNKKFNKQILYHEFTHLMDSLQFIDRPYHEFRDIMIAYSEFHASKIEMIERLEEVEDNNISLQTEITHAGILTIQSFMEQTFKLVKNDFEKMERNTGINNFYYNVNQMYYFFGFVSALKKFNIEFPFQTYEISSEFFLQVNNIQKTLISDKINIDDIQASYLKLEETIKKHTILNSVLKNRNK